MIPSRRLSQFEQVVIEARITRSGPAVPTSGDLYVTSEVIKPREGKPVALVISHQIG
jgi:cytochrome c-type biogenesis protein CcmH